MAKGNLCSACRMSMAHSMFARTLRKTGKPRLAFEEEREARHWLRKCECHYAEKLRLRRAEGSRRARELVC
jgi:hypothetical protein